MSTSSSHNPPQSTSRHRTPVHGLSQTRVTRSVLRSLISQTSSTQPHNPTDHANVSPPKELVTGGFAPTGYPYQTVGLVESGTGSTVERTGTGVLVGRNLLLTSSHLAPWGESPWFIGFAAGFDNGNTPFGWAYVESYYGYHDTASPTADDYIICKLYTNVGDQAGWMGTQWWGNDANYTNGSSWATIVLTKWIDIPAQKPTLITGFPIDKVQDGPGDKALFTEAFATGFGSNASTDGWLGAPIFGPNLSPYVVGVFSNVQPDQDPEALEQEYAGGADMVGLVQYGINNWSP
jgi:hypothetical protein